MFKIKMSILGKNVNILINMHNFFETTYINLQMIRKVGIKNDIYLNISDFDKRYNPRLEQFSDEFNLKEITHTNNNIDNRKLKTYYECWKNYLEICSDENKYVLFTFQDHWLLDPKRLTPYINTMEKDNYDGIQTHLRLKKVEHLLLNSTFYIVKAKYMYNWANASLEKNNGEENFYNILGKLNWYIPLKDNYHQYFYNSHYGMGHFHTFEEKIHYIKLWEEYHNMKLDYNEEQLRKEESHTIDHLCKGDKYETGYRIAKDLDENKAIQLSDDDYI